MDDWLTAYILGGIISVIVLIISYFAGILAPLLIFVSLSMSVLGLATLYSSETETSTSPLFGLLLLGCLMPISSYVLDLPLASIVSSFGLLVAVGIVLRDNRLEMVRLLYGLYCKITFSEYEEYKLYSKKFPYRQRRLLELGSDTSEMWLEVKLYEYVPEGYYIRWITEESIGVIRIDDVDDIINENNSSIMSKLRDCYICGEQKNELYENTELFMASSINKGTPYMCSSCISELQHTIINNTDLEEADIVARKI